MGRYITWLMDGMNGWVDGLVVKNWPTGGLMGRLMDGFING